MYLPMGSDATAKDCWAQMVVLLPNGWSYAAWGCSDLRSQKRWGKNLDQVLQELVQV